MEGNRALDVRFQRFDCRNKLIDEIFKCLQVLIQLAELLERFASKNMNASKVDDQFVLEFLPAVDVDEGALLVNGHFLEQSLGLAYVIPSGSLKHFGIACYPWVKILKLNPVHLIGSALGSFILTV